MITEVIPTVSEYIVSLGLNAFRDRIHKKIEEKKLRDSLKSYIERQRKYNEICTLAEEIDFQGLVDYISRNFLDDAGIRIFDPNPKKRGEARQRIIDVAILYSKANTKQAENRVVKCISSCLDIIRNYYKANHLSIREYLLADMIVDPIVEKVHESTDDLSAKFDDAKKEILTKIETDGALFSLDKSVSLAEDGKFNIIENGFQKILEHISLTHPYYPDFGYDYQDGKILSTPLTAEAKELYPSKYVFSGMMKIGDQYYTDPDGNPLDVAYRHQLLITMDVSKAIKMLGERPDPRQDEVADYVGKKMVITPPEFPPAFPCAIKVKDKTFFDYILFRTQEILDDGTYVIANQEQGGSVYFEIRFNPEKQSKSDFKFHIDYTNNHDMLKSAQFMSALSKEKDLHIYVLSSGQDIIAGHINDVNYETGFDSMEEEIDFLERICDIEEHFHVELKLKEIIQDEEYKTVLLISDLIRNDEVIGLWSEVSCTGILDQHFKEKLMSMEEEFSDLSFVGTSHLKLFDTEISFRFMRTFKNAQIVDLERIKRKAEVFEDGDMIKINFRAGDDNRTIDTLKIPEKIEGDF